jgi:ketosteroid isomerase-like protein
MTDTTDLAARLAALEDRAAIADLVAAYALHAAAAEYDALADLFTVDGIFQAVGNPVAGREVLRGFFSKSLIPGKAVPIIGGLLVEVDGDDATAACLMATTYHEGKAGGFCGRYDDRIRREDGRWKFASRRYSFYHGKPLEAGR